MTKQLRAVLLAPLLIFILLFTHAFAREEKMISGTFEYLNQFNQPSSYEFKYDESWLEKSSYEAPFEMLRFSLCASMAASRAEMITDLMDKIGYSYVNKINEVAEGLNVLAGDTITDSVYYPAQVINGKSYINSIGYAIGKKEVGDSTVILVAVRGGDYGIEWGGNFNVGTGVDHEGFLLGSNQVMDGLRYFIKSQGITGRIKVWVLGYSRGSSVANLTAARLTQGEIPGIVPEDIYGFCFECPRDTKAEDALDEKYYNINCVVNPDDLVPKTAMAVWGYRRYGKTHHLPSYQSDISYPEKNVLMHEEMQKILGMQMQPATDSEYTTDVFANDLAFAAQSPQTYVERFQKALEVGAAKLLGGGHEEITEEEFVALKALQAGIFMQNPPNADRLMQLLNVEDGNLLNLKPNSPLLEAHSMEVSISWIESLKDYADFGENTFRIIYINGAQDITLKDSKQKTVVNVKEGKPEIIEGGLYSIFNVDGEFLVIMPTNESYQLSIGGSVRNMVSLSDMVFDMVLGRPDKITGFGIVALAPDDFLSGSIDVEGIRLTRQGESLKPKYTLEGDEIKTYKVNINSEGDGQVIGGGYFTKGRVAGITAKAGEQAEFDGWFENGKRVTREPFYQIPVEKDIALTAKFLPKKN